MITVILPCAGKGTRLGVPFSKELAPVSPGRVLIDSSLDILAKTGAQCRVIVMDDGTRERTREYVESRLPDTPVALVRQHRYAADWPDAVLRLEPWFTEMNIVMLPDSAYECSKDPITVLAAVTGESGFSFAAAKVSPDHIREAGALCVIQDDTVRAYEDKPDKPDLYNAVWGMLGFADREGVLGMRMIAASTNRTGAARRPVVGAPVVWLESYRDCGTWYGYREQLVNAQH